MKEKVLNTLDCIRVLIPCDKPVPIVDDDGKQYSIVFNDKVIREIKKLCNTDKNIWITRKDRPGLKKGSLVCCLLNEFDAIT